MTGIIINIDPVALRFRDFELRWYSIAIMLAAIATLTVIPVVILMVILRKRDIHA